MPLVITIEKSLTTGSRSFAIAHWDAPLRCAPLTQNVSCVKENMNLALELEDIPNLTFDQLVEHIRMSKINSDEYTGLVKALDTELELREPTVSYKCKHCSHTEYEEHQLRASGGFFSAMFDIQTEKYRVITCKRCKFSEMYQGVVGAGQFAADILLGR